MGRLPRADIFFSVHFAHMHVFADVESEGSTICATPPSIVRLVFCSCLARFYFINFSRWLTAFRRGGVGDGPGTAKLHQLMHTAVGEWEARLACPRARAMRVWEVVTVVGRQGCVCFCVFSVRLLTVLL